MPDKTAGQKIACRFSVLPFTLENTHDMDSPPVSPQQKAQEVTPMISANAYVRVSDVALGWRRPAAAAAAMSAARLATAGHAADIPQHKHIAENFAFVNRGTT